MQNVEEIWRLVEAKRQHFFALSDQVWETPELNFAEYRSAAAHRAMLEREGFRVTTGIAGLPTALMGEAGQAGPVITNPPAGHPPPARTQHPRPPQHPPIPPRRADH